MRTIPIAFVVPLSVNQTFPSGPAAIPSGMLPADRLNSLIACVAGLIIPTWAREGRVPVVRLGPRHLRWTRPLLREIRDAALDPGQRS